MPLVYDELRRLAAQKLAREKSGQTLQATALVHEAYIRLVGSEDQQWDGRGHFFAAAAEAMRRILIEGVRKKQRLKRGDGHDRIDLQDYHLVIDGPSDDILAIDDALQTLEKQDKISADLVKLRFFAGLTIEQAATTLGISPRTADRYWAYARAWLQHQISPVD